MSKNALSALGRMSWEVHFLFYPAVLIVGFGFVKPWYKARQEKAAEEDMAKLLKGKPVDPDLFNPFSPLPYHNNRELPYALQHIRMHKYLNENHINVQDYAWKGYSNSYDHDDEKTYMYNYTSQHRYDH